MPVLSVNQGPRLAAMGGAGIAAVDDPGAIYWNPAGLSRLQGNCYTLSHRQWFSGIPHDAFRTWNGVLSAV